MREGSGGVSVECCVRERERDCGRIFIAMVRVLSSLSRPQLSPTVFPDPVFAMDIISLGEVMMGQD